MSLEANLKRFGLSEKAVKIYLTLLTIGPSSVRNLSDEAGINRGTTYDILKGLMEQSLVSYYYKAKKQYFTAEDPDKFKIVVRRQQEDYAKICRKIIDIIPELKSIYARAGKPVARFYEGHKGIRTILADVLVEGQAYYVYSAESIRTLLYQNYPDFTEDRIKKQIKVKVIAIGKGGKKRGLDERKWLSKKEGVATYTLIYANKIAMISADTGGQPIGIIIKDQGIYKTQKLIFESLWNKL